MPPRKNISETKAHTLAIRHTEPEARAWERARKRTARANGVGLTNYPTSTWARDMLNLIAAIPERGRGT